MSELILGRHSIYQAICSSKREIYKLWCTKESLKLFKKRYNNLNFDFSTEILNAHQFQQKARELYSLRGFEYHRIPSMLLLEASATKIHSPKDVYLLCEKPSCRIVCLDQVTDVHNLAAILRTCAFYNVDYMVISQKNDFRITPAMGRISSGALEHVKLANCGSLSRLINKIKSMQVQILGLSEEAPDKLGDASCANKSCLVLGSEEQGLSYAVERNLDQHFSLVGTGKISSLNVSVAAALAMDKIFNS